MKGRLSVVSNIFFVKVLSMLLIFFSVLVVPANLFSYPRTPADLIEISCGEEHPEAKRILVAYDTIHGSTAEVAEGIGTELCARGFQVDVRLARNVLSVDAYDVIILGSAIYQFNWLPDARKLLKNFYATLSSKPTALFIVCAAMYDDTPDNKAAVQESFVEPILVRYPGITPLAIGLFGGAVDFKTNRYNFFEKIVLRILEKVLDFKDSADWRDWQYISTWSEEVWSKLQ
jgi:menaquinone-dependent protoporphyrinogen oxidase